MSFEKANTSKTETEPYAWTEKEMLDEGVETNYQFEKVLVTVWNVPDIHALPMLDFKTIDATGDNFSTSRPTKSTTNIGAQGVSISDIMKAIEAVVNDQKLERFAFRTSGEGRTTRSRLASRARIQLFTKNFPSRYSVEEDLSQPETFIVTVSK